MILREFYFINNYDKCLFFTRLKGILYNKMDLTISIRFMVFYSYHILLK
ncbi:hypothetical protein BN168_130050 [Clostridioides difficile CD002]|nr:hypothetical protein BN168_130050 [Clostridioides difficile CD002]